MQLSIRPRIILEFRKTLQFLKWSASPLFTSFSDFTYYRQKTSSAVVFSCRLFATFLNTGTTNENFEQSEKKDSFSHILKSSAGMYESSDSVLYNHHWNTIRTRGLEKNFMAPFYGWSSTASRLEPLRRGSFLFTTKFPETPGTHIIDLGRMKGWVDLGATQWVWTRDPWINHLAIAP